MADQQQESIDRSLKVIAQGGARKTERRARILDYKDQQRELRRAARLADKGY